jgi:sugar lactone lactonase YvrE
MRVSRWVLALVMIPSTLWPQSPKKLATVDSTSLKSPEALSYDAARDVYYVSNWNGRNGHGYITRIRGRDGVVDSLHFILGGRNGVTLDAPMGSRIKGDTLWLVDTDALRGFDARTGAPLVTIDLSSVHPRFLNDLAIGPDNDFYVTDTGFDLKNNNHVGPDRIYHVSRDRTATVAIESAALDQPDGIDWDPKMRRLVLAPIGGDSVQEWRPGASAPVDLAPGKGRYDGIEIEKDGTILITSWNDSSILSLKGSVLDRRISKLAGPPADVSEDARRHQVGIVYLLANRFELWTLP